MDTNGANLKQGGGCMYVECLAIVVLILAMWLIFMRARKKASAFAILPLVVVPLTHIAGNLLARPISGALFGNAAQIHIFIDILGLVFAGILFGSISHRIKSRKGRTSYLCICGGFTLVLTFVLILNILK